MTTILDRIVAAKRREVEVLPHAPEPAVAPDRRAFREALERNGPVALIAEIKRRSPSRPLIRADFDPRAMAPAYQAGGAAALSVLTDREFFGGCLDDLRVARAACTLPVLRKDFLVDARQLAEASAAGADAVLLIAAILPGDDLWAMLREAGRWGLEALVEVHDEAELDRALEAGATLVGINNRDLRTFEVDLGTTIRLCGRLARLPEPPLVVSESGIATPADLARLGGAGCAAVLVGEALLSCGDLAVAARSLLARP